MTRSRPYRKALSPELAVAELRRCADTQFDPQVVNVFSKIFERIVPHLQPSNPNPS
jgi:HD-GYP domain-containing protein (c-di-GMP phosphodiesterase class II)